MRTTTALPPTEVQARTVGAPPIQALLLDLAGTLAATLVRRIMPDSNHQTSGE